jgi:hypothetical protein
MRLLRSSNAAEVLRFLHKSFKADYRLSISGDELTAKLQTFLETEVHPQAPLTLPDEPRAYLEQWCRDDVGYLRRFYEGDEPAFELSADAERALQWMEDLRPRQVVGTESRFRAVFRLLEEILEFSTGDIEKRVRELERRRDELNEQIERIIASGTVETISPGEIRERFEEAVRTARGLQGDFRAVEHNFRLITQELQERQLVAGATRGDIVGFVLERGRALAESEQGQSFEAFLRFLLSDRSQHEFTLLLEQLEKLPQLAGELQGNPVLRQLLKRLLAESSKVVRTNHRLAEQLRRAMDRHGLQERRQVAEHIQEIKVLAQRLRGRLHPSTLLLELGLRPDLNTPMERPLWRKREELHLRGMIEDHVEKPPSELQLADLLAVDMARLRTNVQVALGQRHQITLTDLLESHPPEQGVFDLIGYLAIATKSCHHRVDQDAVVRYVIPAVRGQVARELEFPQIYFTR